MVNNRGWLRIVEASIAIMIIFGVLIVVNGSQKFTQEQDLTNIITPMLEEIARNVTLREDILSGGENNLQEIKNFVSNRIARSTIQYEVSICELNEICSLLNYPTGATEIYAGERLISSNLQEFAPKKVKIFLWYGTN